MAFQAHRSTICIRSVTNPLTFAFLRCTSTTAGPFKAPPYPYGPSTRYRRRDSGLYGTATIQFGNLVSDQNEHKSRRVWRPNVHNKRLWSNYLGRFLKVKITSRVLRTLDKLGGLDEYLVGSDTPARIKELGITGWELRWRVMRTRAYRERVAVERRRLGLPERGWAVEEKERKRAEKREAMRVAEAYLKAVKVEEKEAREKARTARSVGEALEQANEEVVKGLEASSTAAEQDEAEKETEPEFEVKEEDEKGEREEAAEHNQPAVQRSGEVLNTPSPLQAPLPPSHQLYNLLSTMAIRIHSHPNSLLKQAHDLIADRTVQTAASSAQKAELVTQRAGFISAIDDALASPHRGPILSVYTTLIARAQYEDAIWRENAGRKALTREQVRMNVLGPPKNVPGEKWAELMKRVGAIQRDMPRRLRERRERREANEERKKYWAEHRDEFEREKVRRLRQLGVFRRVRYRVLYRVRASMGRVRSWLKRARVFVGRVRGEGEEDKVVG